MTTDTRIFAMSEVKTCSKCGESKLIAEFSPQRRGKFGVMSVCKSCKADYSKEYAKKNPDKVKERYTEWSAKNKEYLAQKNKKYQSENSDEIKAKSKVRYYESREQMVEKARQYRISNPDKVKETEAKSREKNKDKIRIRYSEWREKNKPLIAKRMRLYKNNRRENDVVFNISHRVSVLIRQSIKRSGYTKRSRTHEILGCDWEFFKSHVERQFVKGMTWDNRSEWHIDHIRPLDMATTEEEVIALNHFTNLRPLWASDNLAKGAQITHLI